MPDASHHVTAQALERMRAELHDLRTRVRPQVLAELESARTDSINIGESTTHMTAQANREQLNARIAALEARIARSVVVEAADDGVAAVGSYVELDFGDTREVFVLDEQSTVPHSEHVTTLSPGSPMGRAVTGAVAGDTCTWQAPAGELSATVVRVFLP